VKATEIILIPSCIIGNPMVSDGVHYTIIGNKDGESFLVNEWGGLTGKAIAYGSFKSQAYNKALNDRLRLDSQSSALPAQ
jgi:hypothetical protein